LATTLLACDRDPVAAPEPVRFALDAERAADFAAALEDQEVRVVPYFVRSGADLEGALEAVGGALGARSTDDLERALDAVDAFLDELATGPDAIGIAPDLDAVRLVVLQARLLLDRPPSGA